MAVAAERVVSISLFMWVAPRTIEAVDCRPFMQALIKDPSERPTAAELALHPWLAPPVTVSMADPPKTPLR